MQTRDLAADLAGEISEPRLKKLYDYWSSARGTRCCPARRDIDPVDLGFVLGNIMLVDVLREPLRFKVRVHGTEMVERAHYDLTGKLLDDMPNAEFRRHVIERCCSLIKTGRPLRVEQKRTLDGIQHSYEAVWLPLSEDGATINMLLCGLIYHHA
jgi:hypothetical protein